MKIAEFSVKNYQFTLIIFVLLMSLGLSSLFNMPRGEDPETEAPTYSIIVVYPGTSPADMEKIVVDPFEKKINELDDIKKINFIDNAPRYEVITEIISEGEHTNHKSIVQKIAKTITTLYRRRFPDAAANECDDIVTYNPITPRVTFQTLVRSRYLIAAPRNASIISMFNHGARSVKIRASSEWEIDVLPLETNNSAASPTRIRNPLPSIEKVNLRTLDNVFV